MIEDPMVRKGFIFLGTMGGTLYLVMAIFYHRIIENMRPDRETAIAKFFLKANTLKAFKVLTLSGFFLVIILATETYAVANDMKTLATAARYAYPFPMIGLTYFSYTLQKVTRKQEN